MLHPLQFTTKRGKKAKSSYTTVDYKPDTTTGRPRGAVAKQRIQEQEKNRNIQKLPTEQVNHTLS